MSPFDRSPPSSSSPSGAKAPGADLGRPGLRAADASSRSGSKSTPGSGGSGTFGGQDNSALAGRSLVRILCTAGSGALEYIHAFVTAYSVDHFRGAVAQRLSVGAYELLSNALNFGSVSSDIVLELIESDSVVGVRVSNEAIPARISMLTEHLLRLRTNAEQTFMEELRRSVTGGIPRPMLGLARVTHEVGLTLELHVQDRRISVTAQCRR
ncbi:MAG TPA: hypothetical protein VK745_06905 [Polyangiaceae bacterium]|nr:hypothetical protein [Polyangiaceae bacterium]